MIKEFKRIKGLGVFRDFCWDQEVLNANGQAERFQHINVIYGRNYSGKTTLSRLLRALETHSLSEKFENREFAIVFDDTSVVTQDNYDTHGGKVRVFNEDFVRDNLRFINDPDEAIEPFALIGDDNVAIQEQIDAIQAELGANAKDQETGLFAELKSQKAVETQARDAFQSRKASLESQMRAKSTAGKSSIRNSPEKFGDQNYNIKKLTEEIDQVLQPEFKPITDEEAASHEQLLKEEVKDDIRKLQYPSLSWDHIAREAEYLVEKAVVQSNKIEELAAEAVLNRWVKDGREFHRSKRENCAFCGSKIEESRWQLLDKHFDEESEKLEAEIDSLLDSIATEKATLQRAIKVDENLFYSKFRNRLSAIQEKLNEAVKKYLASLDGLLKQLQARKDDLIHSKTFEAHDDHAHLIQAALDDYETLRTEANEYSNSLEMDQSSARDDLRLKTVFEFAVSINYTDQLSEIDRLNNCLRDSVAAASSIAQTIREKQLEIDSKRREMNDEEKGARKVNQYLNDFFGHSFLTLETQENRDDTLGTRSIRFEITRDGRQAHHLSEGETRLLAFCYFMAKLDDVDTHGSKPIIWIDDPICSLDSNHIFFVFSLIQSEVVLRGSFEQLFISTHNLDFLKYLKRLRGAFVNHNQKKQQYDCKFFMVERHYRLSKIVSMPEYLREYVTEFNYLFHQIYLCSKIEHVTDANYAIVYNFGNNARKFLEIFLYYKYPHGARDRHGELHQENMKKFFGGDPVPTILTTRLSNEYSHLAGSLERGAIPVDSGEILSVARLIINRLTQDEEQFAAFLSSVGEVACSSDSDASKALATS